MDGYKRYAYRIVRCGKATEIYAYEADRGKRIISEFEAYADQFEEEMQVKKEEKKEQPEEEATGYKRSKDAIRRAKRQIRRLIESNVDQPEYYGGQSEKFITLTFAPCQKSWGEQPDRADVVAEWKYFLKKFKRKYGTKFEYLAVIERGGEGTQRLHIHFLAFGLGFIPLEELRELWAVGYVYINEIRDYAEISRYVTKYIEKTLEEDYIEKGARFFFPSKGLLKPREIYLNDDEMQRFIDEEELGAAAYHFEFFNEFVGKVSYAKYLDFEKIQPAAYDYALAI